MGQQIFTHAADDISSSDETAGGRGVRCGDIGHKNRYVNGQSGNPVHVCVHACMYVCVCFEG